MRINVHPEAIKHSRDKMYSDQIQNVLKMSDSQK